MARKNSNYKKRGNESFLASCFLKSFHRKGHFSKAEKRWKCMLKDLLTKKRQNPWNVILAVVYRVAPLVDLCKIKVAKNYYQIPVPIRTQRSVSLAVSWITELNLRKGSDLSDEIIKIYEGKSTVLERRKEWEGLARRKMIHARYRWR